ncbi:MAG: HU family DNA-binding protein [Alphaproteobacteria bacterium]|nr:HU family DNA-binding protein [Alphaproteobacteria bacterium]
MRWNDLIDQIATETGESKAATRRVLTAFTRHAFDTVSEGGELRIPGLGRLYSRWSPPRVVRGVHDGRRRGLDGRWQARFRPSNGLREALADRSPQLLRDPRHQDAWRLARTLVGDLAEYHQGLPSVDGGVPDSQLEVACRRAFGPEWEQARSTYARRVPEEIRSERDHLLRAARQVFSTDRGS